MTIKFRCPSIKCGKILCVTADQRGQNVKCPTCKRVVRVPTAQPQSVTAAATPAPPATAS